MENEQLAEVRSAIKAEMARRDLSQTDLARVLGMAPNGVSRRLTGHTPITVPELMRIAHALNVPASVLLGENAQISGAA
jgi:transcriptional regulator with XRE-family HTH domain